MPDAWAAFLKHVGQLLDDADRALSSPLLDGDDAVLVKGQRDALEWQSGELAKLAESLAPSTREHMFSLLWGAIGAANVIGQHVYVTASTDAAHRRERAVMNGQRGRANAQQVARTWKATALPVAVRFDGTPKPLSRDAMATRIVAEINLPVARGSVVAWLQREAEAPNGPIRSRARRKQIS
jgi:hypothetical protein